MGSTFFRKLDHVLLLVWALFVSCNLNAQNPDTCSNVCSWPRQPLFNMADRTHSMATGNIRENGHALHRESNNWCPYPANYKYRTIDGTCNHPRNLGSAFKTLDRLLPAAYDDGFNSPRQRGEDGLPLPSARNVSLLVHPPVDVFTKFTIALMSWGQWIDHDIVATAVPNRRVNCCGPNGGHPPFVTDPDCFPIELPQNDPSFPGVCLSFIRSMAANDSNQVPIKPRKQINTVTSFIDCSQIYGSTPQVEAQVRVPRSYLLRTKNDNFMPESTNSSCIKRQGTKDYCFLAGDFRVNQNPFIGAMHTLWLRDHNRIARKLRLLRPKSSDEEIFQQTRNIIIAKNQVITYNAYLPLILGEDARRWHLSCHTRRSFYNQDLDPSIAVVFATACFRFGHSTISSIIPLGNSSQLLRNQFNRPALVLNLFDPLVAGMVGLANVGNAHMQSPDRNFVEDISRFLFMNQFTGLGLDLVTLNIQRGRDHGIPPYVKWRSFCGLRPLKGFTDTEALGPFVSVLGTVYRSMEDIDLFTGMLHEPVDTGLLGPTIRCILRIQFFRLKYGDRFFFDNDETNSGFSDEELKSLLKVTLSKVICQNTKIESMPVNAFKFPSKANPLIPCSVLKEQDLDLSVFARY